VTTLQRRVLEALLGAILMGAAYLLIDSGTYGVTLFVMLPVILGALSAWVRQARTEVSAAGAGAVGVVLGTGFFLLLGWEGAICIVMTWPLAIPLGALGGWVAFELRSEKVRKGSLGALLLLPPVTLAWDANATPPLFEVRTAIEISAPADLVWKNVVSFSELPEPQEWFFKAGLAYPKRARIDGAGPGAIRYCEFSTGAFVEPIEVWEEARLLRFRVTENPPPMEEWSPYQAVMPRHMHGYLVSKQGQFRLTPLEDGRTLLEGTTWYQHGLWPAQYWRWWSDAIIHRIHLRVLRHIRHLSEADAPMAARN
jgi:hypothetical protein